MQMRLMDAAHGCESHICFVIVMSATIDAYPQSPHKGPIVKTQILRSPFLKSFSQD